MTRRDVDGWTTMRERLREAVNMKGAAQVASEIPVGRSTLYRLIGGETSPTLPTQECVERFLDDEDLRREDG
jgi:DNA-binding phage protein